MRILLISPLPGLDPACGDVTYTEMLLAHPPAGIEYETYADAIRRGTLREHGRRSSLLRAMRTGGQVEREIALTAFSHAMNRARRGNLLFREPFRFFSVKPGEYDLIHLHAINARFEGPALPLVVSNSAPLRYLYTEAGRRPKWQARLMEEVDIGLGRALGMNVVSYYLPQATRIVAMTQYLRKWYESRRIGPAAPIDVVPFFVPSVPARLIARRPARIGFVAKDFDAKGGPTLIEAFRQVRRERREAELWIVGSAPRLDAAEAGELGIRWTSYVKRESLMRDVFPSFDVFAYPTTFDGLPLVVLEAMSHGIPVATSDYQAMPEVVDFGRAGLISPVGDAPALARNILRLLEPRANAHYRAAVRDRFDSVYSADAVRPRLRASYEAAVARVVSKRRAPENSQC